MASSMDETRLGLVLVAPALALMALVVGYPVLSSFWLSLQPYTIKVPADSKFVGFGNYIQIFTSQHFFDTVVTTGVFTVISVSIEFCLGMALALIMNKALGRLTGIVRVAVLIPWCTITVVTAKAWFWIFTPNLTFGGLRPLYAAVANGCPLCGRWSSIGALVAADSWKTAPFIALLLLAGLQSIDSEMYEAADVDGASAVTKFMKITLPALKPAILVALLFRTVDAIRMFDLVYVMTGGANKTETITSLAYQRTIGSLDVGLGSAESMVVFAIVFGAAFVFVKVLGANPNQDGGH
jgi:multiple sugar transport system permease protein